MQQYLVILESWSVWLIALISRTTGSNWICYVLDISITEGYIKLFYIVIQSYLSLYKILQFSIRNRTYNLGLVEENKSPTRPICSIAYS